MFSFDFSIGEDSQQRDIANIPQWYQNIEASTALHYENNLIQPLNNVDLSNYDEFNMGNKQYKKIQTREYDLKSDLIPGVYEGGMKVWECSIDLVEYLEEIKVHLPPVDRSKVIELGCGHGFPAIEAINLGYRDVVFSDFNIEVLSEVCWPNLLLNCNLTNVNIRCLSGDWIGLKNIFQQSNEKFDLILSAETLYSKESTEKMIYMINTLLSDTGIALLATKRYYFGVGGGTYEFENLLKAFPQLSIQIVKSYEDGKSNIRDLIVVKRI